MLFNNYNKFFFRLSRFHNRNYNNCTKRKKFDYLLSVSLILCHKRRSLPMRTSHYPNKYFYNIPPTHFGSILTHAYVFLRPPRVTFWLHSYRYVLVRIVILTQFKTAIKQILMKNSIECQSN